MAQHDMNIANQGFPGFRADLNNALGALVSTSSGATAPATTFAHQLWVDTSADPSVLKIRNADNDAFITIGTINQTDDKFKLTPADGVSTDTISELTAAAGVTIDGVLLKDSEVTTDVIKEKTSATGVTIDGVLLKDSTVVAGAGTALLPSITTTGDVNTGIFFSAANTVDIATDGVARAQINSAGDFAINAGFGSVGKAYLCRAWVNFDGGGTPAIREDGNVTSITDNGTGDYTLNFTTAMPDANYCTVITVGVQDGSAYVGPNPHQKTVSSGSVRVIAAFETGLFNDPPVFCVAIFR